MAGFKSQNPLLGDPPELRRRILALAQELNDANNLQEKYRRIIYAILESENGRIVVDQNAYKMAMTSDPPDTIWKLDVEGHNVVLVSCDEKGEPKSKIVTLENA
jgi:hypothetical protein